MSNFRHSKYIYVFKTFFDVDNSGSIDEKDFELAAERMCVMRGFKLNEGKGAAIHQRLLDVWQALKRADTNNDGAIDQQEWCSMWDTYASGNKALEWQDKYRDYVFNTIDTSGEGIVDEDEFKDVMSRYGVSDSDCSEAFKRATKNNTVTMTKDIFANLWSEFFTTDDPSACGNFIFGKLQF